jgi:hypothetical protein
MDGSCDIPWDVQCKQRFYGHLVVWQLKWSSCSKLALSQTDHHLGALLEPSLPSRVEREETLNTPLWGGLADYGPYTCNPCLSWYLDSSWHPTLIQEKKATLLPSTVKLHYKQTKKALSERKDQQSTKRGRKFGLKVRWILFAEELKHLHAGKAVSTNPYFPASTLILVSVDSNLDFFSRLRTR